MKKMILMSILALSVGQLFGMEKPEPTTVQELHNAVLSSTNNLGRATRLKIWLALQAFADPVQWNMASKNVTDNLIKTIEFNADPKKAGDRNAVSADDREKLMKALGYLYKLKRLL